MTRARLGLTLLELLISLLLLAMISTAVASVTGYAVRLFDRTTEIEQQSEQLHNRTLLRGWIIRAAPSAPQDFEGTHRGLTFRTRSETALAWATGALIVQLRNAQSGAELHLHDNNDTPLQTLRLAATELRIAYYGPKEGETAWHDSWAGQDALPLLIRISGKDPALWPDFVAMPRLSAD
ncbi:hypothetical protein So717_37180 [Roseobacter cerasinus]|uniref:Type II secretion system protein J n=1 Tax=Roseobacter cerasinus TaxID=2602289 RepID=A0A640VYE2_9RHOB|nr:hypothetical protein [Roseobacter cerasinus]GFE51965.1 hypothetical protein So717_37180 [Roseobacter cerasinus]